jgi:hypothetical protein
LLDRAEQGAADAVAAAGYGIRLARARDG